MPLGTVYNIVTRYRVDDNGAEQKVNSLSTAFGNLYDQAKWLLGGALALGTGAAVFQMTRLGVQAEKSKIAIAGTFQVLSDEASTFNDQLKRADDLFKRFSDRSITSPASRAEFRTLFQGLAPAVGGMDIDNEKIAEFTQRSVGASTFTNFDYEQTGRDLRRILKGRAGADVKTFTNLKKPLLEALGASTVQEFNKMAKQDPAKTFEAVNEVLKDTDPMLEAFSNSTAGLFATVKELVNRGLLEAWEGLGAGIRDELEDFIKWYKENEGAIQRFARGFGDKLGNALRTVSDHATKAARNIDKMVKAMATISAVRTGMAVKSGLSGGLTKTLAGILPSAISSAFSADDLAKHLFGGTSMAGAWNAFFSGSALTGSGAGAALFTTLAALIPVVAGVVGMFDIFMSELEDLSLNAQIAKELFVFAMRDLQKSLNGLAQAFGAEDLKSGLSGFSELMGSGFVIVLAGLAKVAGWLVIIFDGLLATVEAFSAALGALVGHLLMGVFSPSKLQDAMSDAVADSMVKFSDRQGFTDIANEVKDLDVNELTGGDGEKDASDRAEETTDNQNQGGAGDINVTIQQDIKTEDDPDRISIRTSEAVSKAINGETAKTGASPSFGR